MPRIIFKCPYVKPGTQKATAHLSNYVRYVATRDGTERITQDKSGLPATKKQQDMVARLIRDFPLSCGLFEYEDYQAVPTQGNASEFITRAIEDNYDQIAKRENYVSYIAQRPRAERIGAHGLFSSSDDPLVLSRIAEEVANHPGNVWLPIISLRREDGKREFSAGSRGLLRKCRGSLFGPLAPYMAPEPLRFPPLSQSIQLGSGSLEQK